MVFDIYPAVDEALNFPPPIRSKLAVAPELQNEMDKRLWFRNYLPNGTNLNTFDQSGKWAVRLPEDVETIINRPPEAGPGFVELSVAQHGLKDQTWTNYGTNRTWNRVTASATSGALSSWIEIDKGTKAYALSTFPMMWKANTAYVSGQRVISPAGDVVTAKLAFTSGTAYLASDWTASGQDVRIASLEGSVMVKPGMPLTADFNDYVTPGIYPVSTATNKLNAPYANGGVLHVDLNGSTVLHKYVTTESRPKTFERRKSGTTWDVWRVSSYLQGSIPSNADLNTYVNEGNYEVANGGTLNKPISGTGVLLVFKVASIVVHWFLTLEETQRVFVRRTSNGVFSSWAPLTWYQGVLVQGVDFDSLVDPGEWSVTFVNHPNQPVAVGGSLTVKKANSDINHEYTPNGDNPAMLFRRKTSVGWTPWVDRLGIKQSSRGAMGVWQPSLTPTNQSLIVTEYTKDRVVGFNGSHSGGVLKETRDDGVSWTDLHTFPASFGSVQVLDNGELIATTNTDPAPRDLWLSSGYGKGGEVTWTKVLSASGPYITFIKAWSFSNYKNILLVNEYGPKQGALWNGQNVTQNARFTYMSLDYGKTWKTIFDLNTYLTGTQGKANVNHQHLHGVAWDPYWDRIWLTFGDNMGGLGSTGILYSDNLGETWQTARFYSGPSVTPSNQDVGIVPMPNAILFATDSWPNGIQRINRIAGKNATSYEIEQAYTINPGVNDLTHLCQAIRKVEREGGDGPVLFGFGAETAVAPSCIIATYDGFSFTKLWEDPVSQAAGRGLRSIAGPTLKGELIVGSNDERTANMYSKWQGPVKIY